MLVYMLFLKVLLFGAIVRALVQFEPIQKYTTFLGILYTAAVAFLSVTMMPGWVPDAPWQVRIAQTLGVPPDRLWHLWVAQTLLISTVYFKLIARFDEGVIFWTLLMMGGLVVLF